MTVTHAPRCKTVTKLLNHSDFTAAAASETINFWSIPKGCQVTGVVIQVKVTPDDSDGDLSAWSLEVGEDALADVDGFLVTHDYIADAPGTFFSSQGVDLASEQGMFSTAAATNLTVTATVVGVTLDDADINAGQFEVYITYVQHAYS